MLVAPRRAMSNRTRKGKTASVLIHVPTAQECDARNDAQKDTAGLTKMYLKMFF